MQFGLRTAPKGRSEPRPVKFIATCRGSYAANMYSQYLLSGSWIRFHNFQAHKVQPAWFMPSHQHYITMIPSSSTESVWGFECKNIVRECCHGWPFILKDGVQPTLCRWVFEINFQKTPTSILKSCLLWRLQCLWGTANHDSEPPWSIGAPRHVSLGGQPPASNQFSFCRTKKHMLHLKRSMKNHKKMHVPRFIVPNAFSN